MKVKIGKKEYEVTKHNQDGNFDVYVVKTEKRTHYIDNGTVNGKDVFFSCFGKIKGFSYFKKENEVLFPIHA